MKFELVSTEAGGEGRFKLEMLACSSDMHHYAANKLKHPPKVGEHFSLETSWPAHKDGLAATQEDYERYGIRSVHGIFSRVA